MMIQDIHVLTRTKDVLALILLLPLLQQQTERETAPVGDMTKIKKRAQQQSPEPMALSKTNNTTKNKDKEKIFHNLLNLPSRVKSNKFPSDSPPGSALPAAPRASDPTVTRTHRESYTEPPTNGGRHHSRDPRPAPAYAPARPTRPSPAWLA